MEFDEVLALVRACAGSEVLVVVNTGQAEVAQLAGTLKVDRSDEHFRRELRDQGTLRVAYPDRIEEEPLPEWATAPTELLERDWLAFTFEGYDASGWGSPDRYAGFVLERDAFTGGGWHSEDGIDTLYVDVGEVRLSFITDWDAVRARMAERP